MAGIRFVDVCKRFGKVVAVKDFSLEVHDREFLTLVGPSGSGKSTLLNLLAGLEDPTSGQIFIADRLVNSVPSGQRDIAMVFQSYALYPHMSVRHNMGFGLKVRRFSKAEIEKRVNEAANLLGISELLDRMPRELSGGQRQRVALGRAITRDPKVFLLDEPLSNLDAKLRIHMRAELKLLFERLGGTVVYVTHDQVEAMTMSDRVVVLNNGVAQQVGAPLEIYDTPRNEFVASFVGSPPMNFVQAQFELTGEMPMLRAAGVDLPFDVQLSDESTAKLAGRPLIVGVRPEDILIAAPGGSSIPCRVLLVEPMGNVNVVHVEAGRHRLVLTTDSAFRATHGKTVNLVLKADKVHLFDQSTSERVNWQTA